MSYLFYGLSGLFFFTALYRIHDVGHDEAARECFIVAALWAIAGGVA